MATNWLNPREMKAWRSYIIASRRLLDALDLDLAALGSGTLNSATAADASRVYGDANPAFTINYTGFKNGENASDRKSVV